MMQIHKQKFKKAALIDPRNSTRNRNLMKYVVSQGIHKPTRLKLT